MATADEPRPTARITDVGGGGGLAPSWWVPTSPVNRGFFCRTSAASTITSASAMTWPRRSTRGSSRARRQPPQIFLDQTQLPCRPDSASVNDHLNSQTFQQGGNEINLIGKIYG